MTRTYGKGSPEPSRDHCRPWSHHGVTGRILCPAATVSTAIATLIENINLNVQSHPSPSPAPASTLIPNENLVAP